MGAAPSSPGWHAGSSRGTQRSCADARPAGTGHPAIRRDRCPMSIATEQSDARPPAEQSDPAPAVYGWAAFSGALQVSISAFEAD